MAEPEDAQCSVSWSSGDSPALSFDEPFCISERGCDNTLRRLTASDADVDQLDALLETVRFDANKEEWLTLLRLDSVVATGVFDARGALVGVATCSRYLEQIGDRHFGEDDGEDDERNDFKETFGWLGNVVVDASFRGRGVARALLRAALEDVGAANAAWLDASDMGMPLYEKAGFEPRSRVVEWRATVRADFVVGEEDAPRDRDTFSSRREEEDEKREKNDAFDAFGGDVDVSSADVFGALARLDASVFGADREALLRAWLASAPAGACSLDERAGYALAHKRGNATYLGPWGLAEECFVFVGARDSGESLSDDDEKRRRKAEAFVDAAVRRAVAAAARDARLNGEADARVVAYVPEPLAGFPSRGESSGTALESSVDSSVENALECTFSAGALMADALARFGFERGDATTRMARRDPACGGPCAISEPGCPDRALTVASLDLG